MHPTLASRPLLLLTAVLVAACSEPTAPPTMSPLGATAAAGKSPQPTFQSVTSTLYDRDGAGTLLQTRGDDHDVSGFATYTETNGVTSHISITGGNGGWQLYLGGQTARTIHLAITEAGFPAPDGYYYGSVEVYGACFDASGTAKPQLSMAGGDSNANCTFGLDFSYNRTKYKLAMGQQYAGTGRALVTCTSPLGAACASWTIAPDSTVANARLANLYRFDQRGALVAMGTYHNSYAVALAKN